MSSPAADAASVQTTAPRERLVAYYTRYYRDTLGIPGWKDLVAVRLANEAYERQRLARLEQVLGRPVAGLRMLNVGCGTGGFNACAAGAGVIPWGVDASAEAVALTAGRAGFNRNVCAAAEALPFPSSRFDLVYCYSTLEHVQDARRAMQEMVRVLYPGGFLYLHTPNRWACFESHYKVFWLPGLPARLQRGYLVLRGRPTAFLGTLRLRSLAECQQLLTQAGARVDRVLDEGVARQVGGPLWPLVRLYYRLLGIHPYVELLAVREAWR